MKLGNLDISSIKIGSADVSKVYVGSNLVYEEIPPTPSFPKWVATYTGGTTTSAECDSTSAITQNEITLIDLASVEIGDCVTSIGDWVFSESLSLTSVTIPNSVTRIGEGAFNDCAFTSVTIPSGVTSIGNTAFASCGSLNSVTIPSGVTSIGDYAFYGCYSLMLITIYDTTPPTLGSSAFDYTNDCPIYVPAESVSAYQSAWSTYASRIFAIPSGGPEIGYAD